MFHLDFPLLKQHYYYEFDEKNYCLLGRRKKRQYRLGDPITIKVAQANLERKQLDFQLAE